MSDYDIRVGMDSYHRTGYSEDGDPLDVWTDVFYVECTNAKGFRWTLDSKHDEKSADAAEAAAAAARANDVNPTTKPDLWFTADPIYGSEAWGDEDEYNLACFEADAYGEPRPRW